MPLSLTQLQDFHQHALRGSVRSTLQIFRALGQSENKDLRRALLPTIIIGALAGATLGSLYSWYLLPLLALIYPFLLVQSGVVVAAHQNWKKVTLLEAATQERDTLVQKINDANGIKVTLQDALIIDVLHSMHTIEVTLTHQGTQLVALSDDAEETDTRLDTAAFPNPFTLPLLVGHHEQDETVTGLQFLQTLHEPGTIEFYLAGPGKNDDSGPGRTREQVTFTFPSWVRSFQ